MARKILIVLTSHKELGNSGKPTGWYLPELAHPYDIFKAADYEMTFASPLGGVAPLDPGSVEAFAQDASSVSFVQNHAALWENTAKLSSFLGKADEFDALFYPGGHGPMFDLAVDADSQQLIAEFVAKGKVVSAVCHGPAVFVNVALPGTGEPLLKGKEVTGFSNVEEDQAQKTEYMPFLLEDRLNEVSGGKYVKAAEPWGVKVVVDGKLITGQNPASAHGVGEAIVKAVG
ncbi:DJ-1/PfpI family protein [Podospora appendiculata]|uniref:D-lactate dehydratase n=1 Tax=Podospora appendiculata TaxID=314037 RepID=A0AAE1CBR3_9PEZI|nr:DJ-1/PfpI family protein [Podospora appendiculata]